MGRSALRNGVIPPRVPSVREVAEEMVPRFASAFGRPVLDIREVTNGDAREELDEMRELIERAKSEAKEENARSGGWPEKPDLSKREI